MEDRSRNGSPNAEISRSAVPLLREYTARGPTGEHAQAERVLAVRHDFQMVMGEELVAVVERTLDRKVIAFMSDNHLDPDLAVEVFILEPTTSEPVG